jgi:hypothetical protein
MHGFVHCRCSPLTRLSLQQVVDISARLGRDAHQRSPFFESPDRNGRNGDICYGESLGVRTLAGVFVHLV